MDIGEDLELNVMRFLHEFLDVHRAIPEAFEGLERRGLESGDKGGLVQTGSHASTAAASSGLDHDWVANAAGHFEGFLLILHDAVRAGGDRYSESAGGVTR